MTTGATGQLGLALPVQGELSGSWGNTVNNGITEYTNIAIAATLTLTNDGAVTLANTTGDASATNITSSLTGAGTVTAQFAIVRITGTLTTTKVVTAPSYSKTYVVVNAATGGTVTFKASGQTGVSIAVGESAWVYYNGTDYVKIVGTATAGAAGGSTTQVQYNSSGSLAGSSNLTFDGTSLTLGGNPTLSAGTANGVTYLNGSKVLTSGSNFTYNNGLSVNGITQAYNTTLYTVDGALSNYSATNGVYLAGNAAGWLNLAGDGTNATFVRIYGASYATPNIIQFNTASSEKMRLDASGNLGIGTSSPSSLWTQASKLVVGGGSGNLGMSIYSSGNAVLAFTNGSGTAPGYNANGSLIYDTSANNLQIRVNGTEAARIDSSGNLGLGVTPSAWVSSGAHAFQLGYGAVYSADVTDSIELASNAYQNAGWKYIQSYTAARYQVSNGAHYWYSAPSGTAGNAISFTQAMTLDASGNLAINTTSPTNPANKNLTVNAGSTDAAFVLSVADTRIGQLYASSGNEVRLSAVTSVPLTFRTADTERARIDSSGNFGLGTTSIAAVTGFSSSRVVEQIGGSGGYGQLRLGNDAGTMLDHDNSGTTTTTLRNLYGATSTSALMQIQSGYITFGTGTSYTERARISAAGGFSVGTTADPGAGAIYATGNITAYYSSDIKFKENVRDIPDALATVNAIGGKLFDWTDEYIESKGGADGYFVQKADFGVVAQDVQKVFPIAVRTRPDGSLAVDYEKLGALAFAALVELTKRVEALEAK